MIVGNGNHEEKPALVGESGIPAPKAPLTLEDTGLSEGQVMDLLIKVLFQRGSQNGNDLAEAISLPFSVIDELLVIMTQRHFVEVMGTAGHSRAGYQYELTDQGRQRANAALAASRYVGPAPVPLSQFREWVSAQSVRNNRVPRELLMAAFGDLVLDDEVTDALGPAVNSGASIFLHGAPGNGKTAIAERLGALISSEIYLPYSIIVDGHIIVIYDPVYHRRITPREEQEDRNGLLRRSATTDRRFVHIERPTVFVGGELTLDQLDLQMSEYSQIYRAPFQIKASGGVLIVDDFGRQRMTPAELLNRWIVPLEMGWDNLTLDTGVKFPVPFDCLLIFATNLNPRHLLDEAFLRRIQFKVEVRSPDREALTDIFKMNCKESGIEYTDESVDLLFRKYYDAHGVRPRGCHPRDILHHIRSIATFEGRPPSLEPDLLQRAAQSYFLVMEEEVQAGITSIKSRS
ncbi:MAG: ATP-binding protein [Gemmatimonadetes bacterium]|nr:ATP-binding protein [Gemmatimonadota bacterium]NNM07437.1 ATP-binding protein [Gemmatimonadota bacterium]